MPTIRYQIRNEYGLADPELHQAADKDDPEAILEGVAMAGLVGVLRQLGDLAEFAAEIFRDLHEEVMGMAARGHGLMLRVQQLEAEFPTIEKSLFSHGCSNFSYNDDIDWRSNIQMGQNLITQGDMPRFILDSYEECHGPPRLFTLDKFDTAGAGACLKRYSDPSFFKMELASSGLVETDVSREKKSRKAKKKGSRWRNGQTLESLLSPLADSNVQPTNSDQVLDKSATRFVRLKTRNLNGTSGNDAVNLRKRLLVLHSDELKGVFNKHGIRSNCNAIPVNLSELSSETRDTVLDISPNHLLSRDGSSTTMIPIEVMTATTTDQMDNWKEIDEKLSDERYEPFGEVGNRKQNFDIVERKEKFADSENKLQGSTYDYELRDPRGTASLQVVDHDLVEDELKFEGSTDGYRTEDIGSELENFVDALNSMESEAEIDSEIKGRIDLNILIDETHEMDDNSTEILEKLKTESSELYSAKVSTVTEELNNSLESGITSIPYCDTESDQAVMQATQENEGVSYSSEDTSLILGGTYIENCVELLLHHEVANSADLIYDGVCNMRTFDMRSDTREESCSLNVINSSLNNVCPQENLDTPQFVSSNQNEISAGHTTQLETDEIPRCFDGSSHSDSSFPEKSHRAENGVELTLQEMTGAHQMLNDHCRSPTESSNPVTDRTCSLMVAVPAVKEMQHSVDQDAKFFASIENREASSGERNCLTSISFVPNTSSFVARHDGLAAEMDHGQYSEELTEETFVAYVKRSEDVPQNKNDPTVGIEDNNVSESPHVGCNSVALVSEEGSLIPQLADCPSDAEDGSSRVKDIADYIEVLEYSSNNVGKLAESVDQDSIENSTETMLFPVPSFAIINGEDCMKEIENTDNIENPSYVASAVGFENDCVENDDPAMPGIQLSRLQFFSDTQESQESFIANSADQSQESPNLNITTESQESYKVNITDETPESLEVKTSESVSSPCSASETCIDKIINSPILVLDNLNFATETNQDNHGKNVEEVDQHTEKISSENSSSDGETYNYDRSLFCSQEAYDLQSVVNSTETLLPRVPYVVIVSDEDSITKIENMDNAESIFHSKSAASFENVDLEKAHLETPKTLQHQLEYFSDTQESQGFCNANSVEESQKSDRLNSTEGSDESPKLSSAEKSHGSLMANTTEESEFLKVQTLEWVSGSEICSDRVKNSTPVLDSLKLPTELTQENPQNNIENMNQIIHVKNLPPETSSPDPPIVCCPEAYCLQSKLQGESTDVPAASCQGLVWIHETDNPTEALDECSYKRISVSLESKKLSLVSDASCCELPSQHSSSNTDIRLHGVIEEEMPIEHVEAYMPSTVNETYPGYPEEFASESLLQNNYETAKQEKALSTYLFSDAASSPQDASTLDFIKPEPSHQNGEYLELEIPANSDVTDILSDEPVQNHHAFANSIKLKEVGMLLSDERLSTEAHVSPECNSEISPYHKASNVSDVTSSHLPRSEVAFPERATSLSYESQSDEPISSFASQNPEESPRLPPLPPLPPLEWRTRKLQLDSPFPCENSSQSLAGRNQFAVLLNNIPANLYVAPSFTLSELPSSTVDQSHEDDALFLDGHIVDLSNESSLVSSSLAYEKSICASGAWEGSSKSSVVDSFAPPLLENQACQNSTLQDESVQSIPDRTSHLNQLIPGLELDKSYSSELSHLNSEKEVAQPRNPFLVESSLGDVNYHFNYGNFGGENLQFLKSTELSLSSGLKSSQPGYVYSWDGSQTNLLGVVPSAEDEWFSIRPRSIRNLPRNPLIEAVAAHDRSTLRKVAELGKTCESKADKGELESNKLQLRKVSEIVKPSNEPKAFERDALLEQIRNKSFSLKPAHVSKRNNKGHSTNIKVAAILEKANALRQAVAGSDEEDGGDSWSDC